MKKFLLVLIVFWMIILLAASPDGGVVQASVPSNPQDSTTIDLNSETGSASALCMPGVYFQNPGDCMPAGPSIYLTQMAEKGIIFPITDLPASKPDASLTYVDVRYGVVPERNAPVYASLEDAMQAKKKNAVRKLDSGFTYISYTQEEVVDGRRFYMIDYGEWMTANDVSRIGTVPLFQGLTFSRTPDHAFGWVLSYLNNGPVETKHTPGYEVDDYTGHILQNHELVHVYDAVQVGEIEWYLVGPDEWLPQKVVARVIPNTTPPEGVPGDRWIEVNLFEQTLAVYDQGELAFATLIASGIDPFWTQPGLFQIYVKHESTPMRGSFEADRSDAYYLEDVPWTMYFDQARALHGAYWRANLGFPQSHGCVNLSVGDSRWIFEWAEEGDWVYVWDPSGTTPTDPAFYGSGGF
jgi:lipoprotein-anchoring transpeptidase ErfK/SrfK